MLYRDISRTLAFFVWILLIPLSIPLGIAIYTDWIAPSGAYPQPPTAPAFLLTLLITALLGGLFYWIGRKSTGHLYRREGLLLVILVYLLTPAVSGLPFYFSGALKNPLDCFFEAVSGLTTTGATILTPKAYDPETGKEIPIKDSVEAGKKVTYSYYGTVSPVINPSTGQTLEGLDALGLSLKFWRCFMQWMGGGGIIVLFVAILPALGVGGKILFQTEVTGPSKESMFPRIKETASQLWKVYFALTALQVILLILTNQEISFFDALTVSFSTISTGGFTPQNAGIAAYPSVATQFIIMIFMILGSISFALYFVCMRGKFSRLNDPELKTFLLIILFVSLLAFWQLLGFSPQNGDISSSLGAFQAFLEGSFQTISVLTSTGFSTANYDIWPFSIQVLMLILMFVGGMAGSTAGGIKIVRQQTFFRIMLNKIESIYRPDTIRTFRLGNSLIESSTALTVLCFFMIVASLAIIGTFFLVLDGVDPETGLTTISCMMNNVGIAFRMGGPTHSFAFLSNFGKSVSCIWMIAGRLEYFALLIIFIPAFWRSK